MNNILIIFINNFQNSVVRTLINQLIESVRNILTI